MKTSRRISPRIGKVDEENKENPHRELAKTLAFSDFNDPLFDRTSHWLLRLASAKNRDVFVNLEGHFFKIRLEKVLESASGQEERRQILLDILRQYYKSVEYEFEEYVDKNTGKSFIMVPFEDAVSLMALHKVVVRDGFANIEEKFYSNLIRLLFMRNLKVG